MLEQAANQHKKDVSKQRIYLKELLNSKSYQKLLFWFENQPQLPPVSGSYSNDKRLEDIRALQSDKEMLATYIQALVQDGRQSQIIEKLRPIININDSIPLKEDVKEGIPYSIKTDLERWKREFEQKQLHPNTNRPIPIIVSEAWSWSKIARSFGARLFYGILIMTGLSVVMEQQGVFRGGTC
jgi:hypothetical protein